MSPQLFRIFALSIISVGCATSKETCQGTPFDKRHGAKSGPSISTAAVSNDGRILALGILDLGYSASLAFEMPLGKMLWMHRNGSEPRSIAFNPNTKAVAFAYGSRGDIPEECPYIEILNPTTGQPSLVLNPPITEGAQSVAFSHDGTLLVTAAQYFTMLWNTNMGTGEFDLAAPPLGKRTEFSHNLTFSLDDSMLAATGISTFLWNLSNEDEISHRFYPRPDIDYTPMGVIFNDDGRLIATGSGPIKVYKLSKLPHNTSPVVCQIPKPAKGLLNPIAFDVDNSLWIQSPAGLEHWSCSATAGSHRLKQAAAPVDWVFQLKDSSFVGLKLQTDWKAHPTEDGKLIVLDAQSGKQLAIVSVPGRPH